MMHVSALPAAEPRTLIDDLLDEQRRLTAVERFAMKHERHVIPAQAKYYRDLIPLNRPACGEQFAFAVNLDLCTGCKACVSACHSLNGLDEEESWRDVGLLVGGTETAWQQTVTTACHHCADPACANGCPTLAYEKDADTGIVRHLDDQCIGCQYCTLKCPYDVPKYSERLGIVRKCDMCHGRLAVGEAPACVQACPGGAIRIEVASIAAAPLHDAMLPGAFESSYTRPATRYHTSRAMPRDATPADIGVLRLEHAHWPLVVMLLLTQAAAGLHVANTFVNSIALALAALVILHMGLAVSVAHLGRPLKAWRAFLGWRKSWMSREIIAFGAYAGMATAAVIFSGVFLFTLAASLAAMVAVFCSAMIYVDTRRPAWSAGVTMPRFFGTALLLGATSGGCVLAFVAHPVAVPLAVAATLIRTVLFAWERLRLCAAACDPSSPLHRSARTARALLPGMLRARWGLFLVSVMALLGAIATTAPFWALLALAATTADCVLERYSYFTASAAPRMPGL